MPKAKGPGCDSAAKKCPKCKTFNKQSAKVCDSCGADIRYR